MPVQQDVFFVHKQDLTMREELCKANSQCNWWLVKNTAATAAAAAIPPVASAAVASATVPSTAVTLSLASATAEEGCDVVSSAVPCIVLCVVRCHTGVDRLRPACHASAALHCACSGAVVTVEDVRKSGVNVTCPKTAFFPTPVFMCVYPKEHDVYISAAVHGGRWCVRPTLCDDFAGMLGHHCECA